VEGGVTRQLLGHAVVHGGRSALPSRCTMQISLYLEERLTRMITVMEIIELSSIFEVHRSRFKGGALQVNLTSLWTLMNDGLSRGRDEALRNRIRH
jgi:hypothetical protein